MKLIPYLVFPGSCKEAMEYYANILGGEITMMMKFSESPMNVDPEVGDRIFNAELRAGDLRLKASDDLPGHETKAGTNISLFVSFSHEKSKLSAFEMLAEGGKILFPIDENFGMLKDKYDIQWMFVSEG